MSTETAETFERKLDEQIERLHACQREHDVESCSRCEAFLGCEIRRSYVMAVYESMSKGDTGGFEF